MKIIASRVLSFALLAFGWALAGVRWTLDLIGYSTVSDDVTVAKGVMAQVFIWFMSLPLSIPWGFALITTMWLMWVSWPRQAAVAMYEKDSGTVKNNIAPKLAAVPDDVSTADRIDPVPFEKRMYVGQHFALKKDIESDRILHLAFLCFNGNEKKIVIQGSSGYISFEHGEDLKSIETIELPAAAFPANIELGKERAGLSDFPVALEQRLNEGMSENIRDIVEQNAHAYLNFSQFNVWVSPADDMNNRSRLSLPNKVKLSNQDGRFFVLGRVSEAVGIIQIGG